MTINTLIHNVEAAHIIRRVFNGQRNFMTPNQRGCYLSRYYVIELSEGDDIDQVHTGNGGLYGVTVISRGTGEHRHDLSQSFSGPGSRRDAENYILQLLNLKD